ncbi:MAG: bifunctional folylpolyglutamate synthase/dihydrofolate synthase [Victivallaceae bacterium]|nr:bifunctional folylpolyglutamate synthase/dihydrofolate synthase [Victivallaceae bacterium]
MCTYEDALKYLENLQLFGIKLGLEQTSELAEAAGSPEKKLKFIHIAGSNGKGSCGAMLNAALRRAGFSTGFYSSPHLVSPRERFRINGEAISETEFAALVSALRPEAEKMAEAGKCLTYFEFTTVMAAKYFADREVDFVIWETGMGGRFDATNIVDPVCSVITNIALDHQQYLGSKVEDIAFEKAGIIKPCRPVVIGNIPGPAKNVLTGCANKRNALVLEAAQGEISAPDFSVINSVWIQKFKFREHYIRLSMPGAMQRENFRIVFTVLEYLAPEFDFCLADALPGLEEAFWPARCQILPGGIIIDGAHNPNGVETLLESLRDFIRDEKITVIFGSFKDKNSFECLEILEPLAEYFVFLPLASEFRVSWDGAELTKMLRKISAKKALAATAPEEALKLTENDPVRLVCGSLYLAGEFLNLLVPPQEVLNI